VPLNANSDILDKAFGSFTTISSTSGVTSLTLDQVQNMCIKSTTSAFLANVTYRIPSGIAGQWVVQNQSGSSAFTLTVNNAAGGTSVTIPIGTVRSIYSDGTNVVYADTPSSGEFVNATVSGTLTVGGVLALSGSDLDGVATQLEALDGSDNTLVMTPLRTKQAVGVSNSPFVKTAINASGDAPIFACRAWVNFDGTVNPPTIRSSGNVSSVTRSSTGLYVVNFSTALPNSNYAVVYGGNQSVNGADTTRAVISSMSSTTTSHTLQTGSGASSGRFNFALVSVAIFG